MTDTDYDPTDHPRVETVVGYAQRLPDGSYEFAVEIADWLTLFDDVDAAAVLHPIADALKATATRLCAEPPAVPKAAIATLLPIDDGADGKSVWE